MQKQTTLVLAASSAAALLVAGAASAAESVSFRVSIESVTGDDTLVLPDGTRVPAHISPGLFVVAPAADVLFQPGARASEGLERLAEDGDPEPLIGALNVKRPQSIAFPFLHNQDFTVSAKPGDRLHFAVMFVQSNDLFYAPNAGGIELFTADGHPISSDVIHQLMLWDAGTEANEAPGVGADQAPRQAMPNTGTAERGLVRPVDDRFVYPASADVIRITITPQPMTMPTN
jgi:hypothetical protein